MDEDLTLEEKLELSEMMKKGFRLALKMESCFPKGSKIPLVMSACAWILEKCRRAAPENEKDDFMGDLEHFMNLCGICIEVFDKCANEKSQEDE